MKLVCRGYGEKGALLHNWWERKLIYSLWRIVWRSLKKLNTEPLYDPEISILGICPEKTLIWKGTCTPLFTAALFTIARTWKQPKCPMTGAWTKKMWCTHNGILLSHWKEWNIVTCRDMDRPTVYHTEWSKSERRETSTVSLQFSCSIVSDSLRAHKPQHARPPCPSPTPGVHPN